MENQRQIEEQIDSMIQDGGKGTSGRPRISSGLRENIHGLTAASQGNISICNGFNDTGEIYI